MNFENELDRVLIHGVLHLAGYQDKSKEEIESLGVGNDVIERVLRLIDISEYKRRQAPLGVKITSRGFGKDRRYPITNKFIKKILLYFQIG